MAKTSRRRIAGIAAASWVLATAVTSFVVWQAVAVFNDGASTNILSAPQVSERLQAATATAAATSASTAVTETPTPSTTASASDDPSDDPSGSPSATTKPTSPPSTTATRTTAKPSTSAPTVAATPVVKTWTVTGGTVSVSCQAQDITLVYASPQDGWRFETEKRGTDRIDVNFQRVGQGTELRASCVNGTPQQTNQPTEGDR